MHKYTINHLTHTKRGLWRDGKLLLQMPMKQRRLFTLAVNILKIWDALFWLATCRSALLFAKRNRLATFLVKNNVALVPAHA